MFYYLFDLYRNNLNVYNDLLSNLDAILAVLALI